MAQTDWSEQPWFNAGAVEYFGGINSSNVHLYFPNSPFFDQTCNNAFLLQQASFNQEVWEIVQSRARFEAELRKMAGIEYMVSDDPPPGTEPKNSIWVIKKQEREKTRLLKREGSREWEEEVTQVKEVLGTYYVIEFIIYEAPSVERVLQSKLLTIQNCLTNFLSAATQLPLFDSVSGHHYLSPSAMATKAAKENQRTSQVQSRSGSVAPSPGADRDVSVDPLVRGDKASQGGSDAFDTLALLAQSFQLSARYGSEYMDENPLHGEPGSFVFASSTDHLRAVQQAQQTKAKAAAPAAPETASPASGRLSPAAGSQLPSIKTEESQTSRKVSPGAEKSPTSATAPKLKRKRTGKAASNSPVSANPT